MSAKSIEDAVLAFVQRVKNDPGVSDLFRDALHELEVAIDPSAADQSQGDETGGTGDGSAGTQQAPEQGTGGEQPQGDQGTGGQVVPPGQEPMPEQAPQGG